MNNQHVVGAIPLFVDHCRYVFTRIETMLNKACGEKKYGCLICTTDNLGQIVQSKQFGTLEDVTVVAQGFAACKENIAALKQDPNLLSSWQYNPHNQGAVRLNNGTLISTAALPDPSWNEAYSVAVAVKAVPRALTRAHVRLIREQSKNHWMRALFTRCGMPF